MLIKIVRLFAPFAAISRDLSIIRELYEMELASRNPPIIRVTESPKKSDTEVTYSDQEGKSKSKLRQLLEEWDNTGEEDGAENPDN